MGAVCLGPQREQLMTQGVLILFCAGHAYAMAIRACAGIKNWTRAVALFEEMAEAGIKPDVVSCTALVNALASSGEASKAEALVHWMLSNGIRPNVRFLPSTFIMYLILTTPFLFKVRTYTALIVSLGNSKQFEQAVELLYKMQHPEWGGVKVRFTYGTTFVLVIPVFTYFPSLCCSPMPIPTAVFLNHWGSMVSGV